MFKIQLKRKLCFVAVVLAFSTLFLLRRTPQRDHLGAEKVTSYAVFEDPVELLLTDQDLLSKDSGAALNATLGFQKILALSARPSWRTRGLGRTAVYSGLQLDIVTVARPDAKTIEDFLAVGPEKAVKPDRGSTLAWLGHLAMLQNIVASRFESALIVEDDVDWDVAIKSQMRKLASATQHLTNTTHQRTPYGSTWDVLWLGHCGETWWRGRSSLQYPDSLRIPQDQYTGWTASSFDVIRDSHRLLQWASGPTCSFAYAVTLEGARKILSSASKGQSTAFDTELSDLCVFGSLKCVSVTPQLFMHHVPKTTKGQYGSEIDRENKDEAPVDDHDLDLVMGHTQNIVKSARCMATFGKTCLPESEGKEMVHS